MTCNVELPFQRLESTLLKPPPNPTPYSSGNDDDDDDHDHDHDHDDDCDGYNCNESNDKDSVASLECITCHNDYNVSHITIIMPCHVSPMIVTTILPQ